MFQALKMTEELFETGTCQVCRKATNVFCDECNKWCCEEHSRTINIAQDEKIHLCSDCVKHAKLGVKIGGVIMTAKMLSGIENDI
jgi:hypothetical protein